MSEQPIAVTDEPASGDGNLDSSPLGLERLTRRRRRASRTKDIVYPLGAMVLAVLIWQAAIWVFEIRSFLLPSPMDVLSSMIDRRISLIRHSYFTLQAILLGFGVAVGFGIPLAIVMTYSGILQRAFYPLLVVSQAIPKIAVAPLFLVWLGFGLTPKVAIAALIAFFPIVVNTVTGLTGTPVEMIHLARSMGAGPIKTFYKISFPHALPSVFAGLKIAITFAVIGAVVGEFVATNSGLGYLLLIANGQLRTDLVFATIVALSVLGVILFYVVQMIEHRLLPHARQQQAAGLMTGL